MTHKTKTRIKKIQGIMGEIIPVSKRGEPWLNENNKDCLEKIDAPPGFYKANLGTFSLASKKGGETQYQRELYKNESRWLDMELPPGKGKTNKPMKIDLIGRDCDEFILCELKNENENPFDALLQVLVYYLMIQQNAEMMDAEKVHHKNARCQCFKWVKVRDNVKLLIKAKKWGSHEKVKITALKKIIKNCGDDLKIIVEDENGIVDPFSF